MHVGKRRFTTQQIALLVGLGIVATAVVALFVTVMVMTQGTAALLVPISAKGISIAMATAVSKVGLFGFGSATTAAASSTGLSFTAKCVLGGMIPLAAAFIGIPAACCVKRKCQGA